MENEREALLPDKKLAAVCGLFCPSCTIYIASKEDPERLIKLAERLGKTPEETRCEGCHSEKRTGYCHSCGIVKCASEKGLDFCGECQEYPCTQLKEFQSMLPHRIELWQSQERINEVGYEKWFNEMIENYSCPNCSTINSAFDLQCRKCSTKPSCTYVDVNKQEILQRLSNIRK